jgi:hypothetical protein
LNDQSNPNILEEFAPETEWAAANGMSIRTSKRLRDQGLPYVEWCGKILIHLPGSRQFLAGRIRKNNQPRKAKNGSSAK